jgi:site-specific recombinase XerD
MKTNNLATRISSFLQDYLTLQKGFSRHTILSYRDTIKLFLNFVASHDGKSIPRLTLTDLTPTMVTRFLDHLEKERKNSIQTRNIRLACIHSFCRYLVYHEPLLFDQCQRTLAVPFKRMKSTSVEYLEREEMKAILQAVDRSTADGYRDYTLLSFMYNTGARVQEVIDLPASALQLERPFQVRFVGKGGKERLCPLWPETVKLLHGLLNQRGINLRKDAVVFVNHRGQGLTRYGVRYLLNKYADVATQNRKSLEQKRIHPHTIRHTTATHLLQSGVDINTIRAWLGHTRLETTNCYAEIDLEMKRKVLNNYLPISKTNRPWKRRGQLIQWLESL